MPAKDTGILSRRLPRRPTVRKGSQAEQDAADRILVRRYQEDSSARQEIVEAFMPLVTSLARRYHRGDEPLDDLRQVAFVGLLKALRGFKSDRGSSFVAFAVPTITGELRRHYRDRGWSVHVPRDLQELSLKVARADDALSAQLGRSPTPAELAEAVDRPVEDVLEARMAIHAMQAGSLDRPLSDEENGASLLDTLGDDERGFGRAEAGATVGALSRGLPERERRILVLRFAAGLSQQEIGDRVGLSQMHVSRLLRQSLQQMATAAEAA